MKEKIKKGSPSTKTDLDSANYLIIDYDTMAFNGPPYACIVCPQMIFPTEETLVSVDAFLGMMEVCDFLTFGLKSCSTVFFTFDEHSNHKKFFAESTS